MKAGICLTVFLLISTAVHARSYTVKKIIDGDVLELDSGEVVRLAGIDCPENFYSSAESMYLNSGKKWKRVPAEIEAAEKATAFVRWWVEGREVWLEFDEQRIDQAGRLLAYAGQIPVEGVELTYMPEMIEMEGQKLYFLNANILQGGHCEPLSIPPNIKYEWLFERVYHEVENSHADEGDKQALIACAADVKLCSDGSYVARVPPECEFRPCPGQ